MLNTNNTLIAGGNYIGNELWNKNASSLDNCFKIYQVVDGEAILFSNVIKYTIEKGGIYFINGFEIEKQCCPNSFQVNWIHFMCDSITIKQYLQKLPVVTKLNSYKFENLIPISNSFSSYFRGGLLQKEDREVLSGYLKIQSLLIMVEALLVENIESKQLVFKNVENRLSPAFEFLNINFKKSILLNELAQLCFISENYFHILFKNAFNTTPNNYILQLRMNEAIKLLLNSKLSIKEIAQEIGYFDAAYFSRTFTKYYKMSPKKYRNSLDARIP